MRLTLICPSLPDPLVLQQYECLGADFQVEVLAPASANRAARSIFSLRPSRPEEKSLEFRYLPTGRDGKMKRREVLRHAATAEILQVIGDGHEWIDLLVEARDKYKCPAAVNVLGNSVVDEVPAAGEREAWIRSTAFIDAFLVHTRGARRILMASGVPEEKTHLIPPGIDPESVQEKEPDAALVKALGINESHFVVLAWIPLVWESGVYELLGAAREMFRWGKQERIRVLIFGDGPEKGRVRDWIKAENLGGFVAVGDEPHSSRVPGILNLADVFVLPSIPTRTWNEPLPVRMLLAMAAGAPVIASDIGEIPDFLGTGGILLPPRRYYELADAIIRFSENPENLLPYARSAKIRATDQFNIQQTSMRLRRFYERLTA